MFCFYHERSSHSLKDCEKFQKLSFRECKEFIMSHRICLRCVNSDKHIARNCDQKEVECKICKGKHPTCLHNPAKHDNNNDDDQVKTSCTKVCGENQAGRSCARIVLLQVFHQDDPTVRVPTYAVLDDQSTDVFVTDALLEKINTGGPQISLEVNTIVGVNSIHTRKVSGLCVQDVEGRHQPMKVNYAYSREDIPADKYDIATPEIARRWNHLREIAHHIHYRPDVEIGMLIGRNVPTAFQPLNIIYGKEDEPWAEQYKFGWTIIGRVCLDHNPSRNKATVNCVSVNEKEDRRETKLEDRAHVVDSSRSKDMTSPKEIKEMMQLDYNELHYGHNVRGTEQTESAEDMCFNKILTEGIHKNAQGNWEMPLPFKADEISLPNNREYCLTRLLSLKKKMQKDEKLRTDYVQFMENTINRKHASRVPDEELQVSEGQVWFLPHLSGVRLQCCLSRRFPK